MRRVYVPISTRSRGAAVVSHSQQGSAIDRAPGELELHVDLRPLPQRCSAANTRVERPTLHVAQQRVAITIHVAGAAMHHSQGWGTPPSSSWRVIT